MKNKKDYGLPVWSSISKRKVLPHQLVWEEYYQKEIPFDEKGRRCVIHHINGDTLDNRIENLLCMTCVEHTKLHKQNGMDEQIKNNISETIKDLWENNTRYRDKTIKAMKENHKQHPEIGEKIGKNKERNRKISESKKGVKLSDEHIQHLKDSHWTKSDRAEELKKNYSNKMKGRKLTDDHKDKLSTKVYCVETGELFNSVKEAANKYGTYLLRKNRRKKGLTFVRL